MAVYSGFFNSVKGDRRYNAIHFAEYFSSFIGNGVFPNPSSGLKVVSDSDMNVKVSKGKAWINGYFLNVEDDQVLKLDIGNSSLSRIDMIVIRLDMLTREISLKVKQGDLGSIPKPANLQRDETIYELCIAEVTVRNGMTKINQGDIRDTRHITERCGIVATVVKDIDVSELYSQYEYNLQELVKELNSIIESENVAGELMTLINSKQDKVIKDKLNNAEYELEVRNGKPYLRVVKV